MHLKRTSKSTDKDRTCFSNSTVDYSNNPSSYLHAPNQTSYAGGSEWFRHHERRYSAKEQLTDMKPLHEIIMNQIELIFDTLQNFIALDIGIYLAIDD